MNSSRPAANSSSLLHCVEQIPEELAKILELPLPRRWDLSGPPVTWDVVGLGASEGPARLFCNVANRLRVRALHVAPSNFLKRRNSRSPNHGLVLFSQGLSPHAKLALAQSPSYDATIVITSKTEAEVLSNLSKEVHHTVSVAHHPPGQELTGLLRVVGSTCAALLGLRIAQKLGYLAPQLDLQSIPNLYQTAASMVDEQMAEVLTKRAPTLCLAGSDDLSSAHQLMWKWQEATCLRLPPVIDVLAFAHGPFQSIYDHEATILALRSESNSNEAEVWQRVNAILVPERHQVLNLTNAASFPLSYFAHEAAFLRHLAAVLVHRGINLSSWPGQHADRPLYELNYLDIDAGL